MLIVATAALVQARLGPNCMHCYYIHKTSVYTHLNASVITFTLVQKIPLRVPARWQRHMHNICLYLWRMWKANKKPPQKLKVLMEKLDCCTVTYKAARQQLFCTHCNISKCMLRFFLQPSHLIQWLTNAPNILHDIVLLTRFVPCPLQPGSYNALIQSPATQMLNRERKLATTQWSRLNKNRSGAADDKGGFLHGHIMQRYYVST